MKMCKLRLVAQKYAEARWTKKDCMSRYLCYITDMAHGKSGRIVIEVEPETKRKLYAALALSGSTLKTWFLQNASEYIVNREQPLLPGVSQASRSLPQGEVTRGKSRLRQRK